MILIENEIKILYSLEHNNIIKLYEHFEDEKHLYLVMEYCPNKDMKKLLDEKQNLDSKSAIKYIR